MSKTERPQIVGSVCAAYLKEVEARKLVERVRARASPELQKILARPPLPISWIDGAAMAQLADALVAEAGEKVCSDISFDAMRRTVGPLFGSVGRVAVAIMKSTPTRVFQRIESVTALTCRGFTYSYDEISETKGVMRISAVAPLSLAYWITWEGPLGYVFDLCKVSGTVRRDPGGVTLQSAKYFVEWSASA